MGLPTDDKARKKLPIFTGVLMYFPDAIAAVAEVSRVGNEQHNPGEPLHWAREKSTDQMNTAIRHMIDHGRGNVKDIDGCYHLAKAIWRLSAELQLTMERVEEAPYAGKFDGPFDGLPGAVIEWNPLPAVRGTKDCCTAYNHQRGCERAKGHPGKHMAWKKYYGPGDERNVLYPNGEWA